MELTLNEYIKLFKEYSENENTENINHFKQNFSENDLFQLKSRNGLARDCILQWRAIASNKLTQSPPLVFTGNIGVILYNSIFDALLEQNPFSVGCSCKSINSINDKEFLELINLTLSKLLITLELPVHNINDFEEIMRNIRNNSISDLIHN